MECAEVGDMLRALGCNPTEGEVKKIVEEIDPTGKQKYGFGKQIHFVHLQRESNF